MTPAISQQQMVVAALHLRSMEFKAASNKVSIAQISSEVSEALKAASSKVLIALISSKNHFDISTLPNYQCNKFMKNLKNIRV
jgi:hypothetical protein